MLNRRQFLKVTAAAGAAVFEQKTNGALGFFGGHLVGAVNR